MKKIFGSLVMALLLALALAPSAAWAQQVTIENNTSEKLVELYISNADTSSWENNVLKGQTLAPGDTFQLTFDGRFIMYDLKVVYDSGREQPYYGVNVRKFNYIRLNSGGLESFHSSLRLKLFS